MFMCSAMRERDDGCTLKKKMLLRIKDKGKESDQRRIGTVHSLTGRVT